MLKGKAAIITGSSRGIGREIAREFAKNGADIVISGNKVDLLLDLQKDLQKAGRRCEIVSGDISDPKTSAKLAEDCIRVFGKIDILVNNAGINSRVPFLELTAEEWRHMIDVNLNGAFYACKAVAPQMIAQKSGAIVNISSSAGKTFHANAAASYGASKAAMDSLTRQLAYEFGKYGIRVNGISPGPVLTDMSAQWTEEYRRIVTDKIPLGRLGTPQNIADIAVFLASDRAAFITGETINANGGSYMN
ncbi:MAG: SDR family oxidoreductase [Fusobacteriaceae bacterium]|jgi:3-oxoacyl-[acyl-carrier protein] reductase|nr:SDR family oxidoreductase [Fusobacteriaceae bacterium]